MTSFTVNPLEQIKKNDLAAHIHRSAISNLFWGRNFLARIVARMKNSSIRSWKFELEWQRSSRSSKVNRVTFGTVTFCKKTDDVMPCFSFRLTKPDDYLRVIFDHFVREFHFLGSWDSRQNWLEPKTKLPFWIFTKFFFIILYGFHRTQLLNYKLNLPEFVKRAVIMHNYT